MEERTEWRGQNEKSREMADLLVLQRPAKSLQNGAGFSVKPPTVATFIEKYNNLKFGAKFQQYLRNNILVMYVSCNCKYVYHKTKKLDENYFTNILTVMTLIPLSFRTTPFCISRFYT